ncbi:MAG: ATP-binding cassette domain-containing protein, partial [Acidimicrobiales bacterium]
MRQFDGLTAVDEVDLDIPRGEIYGFLGPNGAGKSTTVRMLCTLLAPTGGRAWVAGHDVASQPGDVRLRIGAALQEAALDPKQTGAELLRLQGLLYGLPKSAMPQRVAELGELIDLSDALDRPIDTYSGGMKRRLEIARGLIHAPRVLFLDEPTVGLDPQTRVHIWDYVDDLRRRESTTMFLTTHYMDEAERCDRIAIIDQGRIVAIDTPDALKAAVGTDCVAFATADDALAACQLGEAFGIEVVGQN